MEIYAISSLATAVSSTPGKALTGWLYSKFMKWRLKKKLYGIVVLKGCSTICQKLSSSNVLFFDIDTIYRELTAPKEACEATKEPTIVENYTAYPLLRNHVINITKIYKGKVVVVSHSLELLQAVGVYNENITFYAFSREMEKNIGVIFPSEQERAYAELSKFRIMREISVAQVVVVDNLGDLEKKVKEKYNLNKISI